MDTKSIRSLRPFGITPELPTNMYPSVGAPILSLVVGTWA